MAGRSKSKKLKKLPGFLARGGIYYCITDPVTGLRKSTGCHDPEAALLWRANRERMKQLPAAEASRHETVGEWLDKFVSWKATKGLSEATIEFWQHKLKPVRRIVGESTPLSEIDTGTIDHYIEIRLGESHQGKQIDEFTVRREINGLLGALKRAKRAGKFAGDIEALTPEELRGTSNRRQRAPTAPEVVAIMKAMPDGRTAAFTALGFALAARRKEAWEFRPEDVVRREFAEVQADGSTRLVKRMFVKIHGTKTEESDREIPILRQLEPLVEFALPFMPIGKVQNISRLFKNACKRAGVERVAFKDFRRGHSTELGSRGVQNQSIAGLLGHTTVAMAQQVYNQAKAEALAPVVQAQVDKAAPIDLSGLDDVDPTRKARGRKLPDAPPSSSTPCALFSPHMVHVCSMSANLGRAPQDSNLRPLDSKAEAPEAVLMLTGVWDAAPKDTEGHQRPQYTPQRTPTFSPLESIRPADADLLSSVDSTGFSRPLLGSRSSGQSDLADLYFAPPAVLPVTVDWSTLNLLAHGRHAPGPDSTDPLLELFRGYDRAVMSAIERNILGGLEPPCGRPVFGGEEGQLVAPCDLTRGHEGQCSAKVFGAVDGHKTSSSTVRPEVARRDAAPEPGAPPDQLGCCKSGFVAIREPSAAPGSKAAESNSIRVIGIDPASGPDVSIVPVLNDSMRVVAWATVTAEDIEADLATPSPYPPQRRKYRGTYGRVQRAASAFADRFGGEA